MDISIIIGLGIAYSMMAHAIGIEAVKTFFYHPDSMLIVLGGTFGATLIHFPIIQVIKIPGRLKVIFSMKKMNPKKEINLIIELSKEIQKHGEVVLGKYIPKIKDPFLVTALRLIEDGANAENIKRVMEDYLHRMRERHEQGISFFDEMGKYAPAFGLLGTVIGLIKLLSQLQNPEAIGPGMSIALITTFYGILLANLVFKPIAGRLQMYSDEEIIYKEMTLAGIMGIANGDASYIIREEMATFLTEKRRKSLVKRNENAQKKN